MTEFVINIPDQLVISVPTGFLVGFATAYYLAGFALNFMACRISDDDPISEDVFVAGIMAFFWPVFIKDYATVPVEEDTDSDQEGDT